MRMLTCACVIAHIKEHRMVSFQFSHSIKDRDDPGMQSMKFEQLNIFNIKKIKSVMDCKNVQSMAVWIQ